MMQVTSQLYILWDKTPLVAKKIKAICSEVSEIRTREEIEFCYLILIPCLFRNEYIIMPQTTSFCNGGKHPLYCPFISSVVPLCIFLTSSTFLLNWVEVEVKISLAKRKKKKRKIIPTLAIVCTASVPLTICHNESLPKGKLFGDADGSQCCEVLFGTNLKITFHQRSKKRPRITFSQNDQLRSQWLLHTQATSFPPTTLLLLLQFSTEKKLINSIPMGHFIY